MSYKVSFLDNQVCGVDDFNAILSDIAQGGVVSEDFDKTTAYQMSKMNVVTKGVVSQGVTTSEKSLACTVGTDGVHVAPGVGIFGSGAKIKVTESELVTVKDIENAYVYACHDMKNNMAGLKSASDGFPAEVEGELYILPLCQIVGGVFSDKREYAKAKVKVCEAYNSVQKRVLVAPNKTYDGQEVEIDVGGNRINFLCFIAAGTSSDKHVSVIEEPEYGVFKNVADGTEGADVRVYLWRTSAQSSVGDIYLKNFRRGNNGEILATVSADYSGSVNYTLYSSVYEEVSE